MRGISMPLHISNFSTQLEYSSSATAEIEKYLGIVQTQKHVFENT